MFSKLALRNVRRSFRDYGIYFLTLTFGVCLFYTFNSIEGQGAMAYLAQREHPMVEVITILVNVFSIFVAVVLACLILYANGFLLRRRKRELGTYLLLGLSQWQVSRLLFLETGVIGLISLAAGLALGILASFGLSALTLSMFQLDVSGMLGLNFSLKAAGKTLLYFGLIFLLVMMLSGLRVSRSRLIDLIHSQRKNEVLKVRSLTPAVIQLAAGILCLGAAYATLLTFGMAIAVAVLPICIPMLTLGTVGTLLIFRSLSGFVIKLVQSHPTLYYKNLNLFTLRHWLSQVHPPYPAQTVVCILLLLAIGITASSVGLNNTIASTSGYQAPFDITIQNLSGEEELVDFEQLLNEAGFDTENKLAWSCTSVFYYNDPDITGVDGPSAALKVSDYDALMARQGTPAYSGPLPHEMEDWDKGLTTGSLGLSYVLIPDDMARELSPRRQIWSADYIGDKEATEDALMDTIRSIEFPFASWITTRLAIYQDLMGSKILALFLGLYLGFTFLLAAAAVLALQQLSQAADNAGRYALLRRLGAEEKLVARSASQQVALAFLLPLVLALIHSVVGMKAANDLIATAGKVDSVASSTATALVLVVVYGGYFLATALACRRMAKSA